MHLHCTWRSSVQWAGNHYRQDRVRQHLRDKLYAWRYDVSSTDAGNRTLYSRMTETNSEATMDWTVYLSGEIHSDWRQQIVRGAEAHRLPINFTSAVTDHEASDAAGDVLGIERDGFWRDHKSSKVNAIRTRTLLENSDLAVIRFGDKYRQWNAAFDAGYCAALGKAYISLHAGDIIHPLKEVDSSAMAWAQTPEQVVEILKYVTSRP